METSRKSIIVDSTELFRDLSSNDLLVVDARDESAYEAGHIVGAVNLDPQTLERSEQLGDGRVVEHLVEEPPDVSEKLRDAGIAEDSRVVIYDDGGGYIAERLYWVLDYLGHKNHVVLDGGFQAWREEIGIVTRKPTEVQVGDFVPRPDRSAIAEFSDVLLASADPAKALCHVSAGGKGARGTIPGSSVVTVEETFSDGVRTRGPEELQELLRQRGLWSANEVIFYCGCGYAACRLYMAARLAGLERVRVYDGSLQDWSVRGGELVAGERGDAPKKS